MRIIAAAIFLCITFITQAQSSLPVVKVSANKRFFETADGKPFFWLGDTGWLLFSKLDKNDVLLYLDARQQQGFNVIQAMVLHEMTVANIVKGPALIDKNAAQPNVKDGPDNDYWDNVDFVITEAAKRGIYMALVPVWGSNVKAGHVSVEQAKSYGKFLGERYKNYSSIIWLNGGDVHGTDIKAVWEALGSAIKQYDPGHIMTYHPRGRYSSTEWFHNASWLDFNMFQSGHRTYAQDTSANDKNHYGEDNWRYVNYDYALTPTKPTLDGEPSYENIPLGLHDSLQPRWQPSDLRRYGYWSVFAGGAGFTYGENAVMQFHTKGDKDANYGVTHNWKQTLQAAGANQMKFLKQLILSKSYYDRVPAQEIIEDNNGKQYNYILATKGKKYAMAYTYTGKNFRVNFAKLGFKPKKALWFKPENGQQTKFKLPAKKGVVTFNPPGEEANGNDWVLILE